MVYTVQVLILMVVVYPALLVLVRLIAPDDAHSPLRYVIAILPAVPVAGVAIAYVRWLRQADELERRIQLEAMAFSAIVTILGVGTYVVLTDLPAWVLFLSFMALWLVGVIARKMWLNR
ncbi:hypothetical protein GCM10009765_62520 [Fodinicola feengrottensis]|uniref:Integral membrane protein n=1 Tax=Fodinicola feengrottensis TaxID=435914 RepID=A0ABN2IGY5_9ACTN